MSREFLSKVHKLTARAFRQLPPDFQDKMTYLNAQIARYRNERETAVKKFEENDSLGERMKAFLAGAKMDALKSMRVLVVLRHPLRALFWGLKKAIIACITKPAPPPGSSPGRDA